MTPSPASRLLDLIERSVIVQALVTLALVGAVIYLAIAGRPVPELLTDLAGVCLGFYFGSKVTNAAMRASSFGKQL